MSPISWIMSLPLFLLCTVVGICALRAHRAAQDIMVGHPKSAGRLGNFSQLSFMLSMGGILAQALWALSQDSNYQPNLADVVSVLWGILVFICLLVWNITVFETAKDKLVPTRPCRPCPWRGEGEAHLLPAGCCNKSGK